MSGHYDPAIGYRELVAYRSTAATNPLAREIDRIATRVAKRMADAHFTDPYAQQVAGDALIIATASFQQLIADEGLAPDVVMTLAGLVGLHLAERSRGGQT